MSKKPDTLWWYTIEVAEAPGTTLVYENAAFFPRAEDYFMGLLAGLGLLGLVGMAVYLPWFLALWLLEPAPLPGALEATRMCEQAAGVRLESPAVSQAGNRFTVRGDGLRCELHFLWTQPSLWQVDALGMMSEE